MQKVTITPPTGFDVTGVVNALRRTMNPLTYTPAEGGGVTCELEEWQLAELQNSCPHCSFKVEEAVTTEYSEMQTASQTLGRSMRGPDPDDRVVSVVPLMTLLNARVERISGQGPLSMLEFDTGHRLVIRGDNWSLYTPPLDPYDQSPVTTAPTVLTAEPAGTPAGESSAGAGNGSADSGGDSPNAGAGAPEVNT